MRRWWRRQRAPRSQGQVAAALVVRDGVVEVGAPGGLAAAGAAAGMVAGGDVLADPGGGW